MIFCIRFNRKFSLQISILEYKEDSYQIDVMAIYSHNDQIWVMETSPQDMDMVVTSSLSSSGVKSVRLWKMNQQEGKNLDNGGINLALSPINLHVSFTCDLPKA